VFNWPGLTLR